MESKSNSNLDRFNLILKAAKIGHTLQSRLQNDPNNKELSNQNLALLALNEAKLLYTKTNNNTKDAENTQHSTT